MRTNEKLLFLLLHCDAVEMEKSATASFDHFQSTEASSKNNIAENMEVFDICLVNILTRLMEISLQCYQEKHIQARTYAGLCCIN